MNDRQRERIAKEAAEIILEVWCDRQVDEHPYFNCHHCELEDKGHCRLKTFIAVEHYPDKYPTGCLAREVE